MNGVLLVDKPKGITSFDVCFKLRKVFGIKKIGHTGTLDPNATGLMMVLIGNSTKINQFLLTSKKEYIGEVLIGTKTDSLDIDGNIIEKIDTKMPCKEIIVNALKSFIGTYEQIPPMLSAKRVNGKKLYEYFRENKNVDIKPQSVTIYDIELLSINDHSFTYRALVSTGTYIRTLTQDILNKLNVIGTLKELRRTKIDDFDVNNSINLNDINLNTKLFTNFEILSKYYKVINVDNPKDIIDGKPLKLDIDDEYILCANDSLALAIYKKDGLYRCVRGLL